MDILTGLLIGLIRDVLIQGAGNCIVHLIWRGRVIPDIWQAKAASNQIVTKSALFYRVNGEKHMYAGPVFGIGIAFWAALILCVFAYVRL